MLLLFPVIGAVVLVTLGYFVMWTSSQANTPKGVALFGKVMSIILFVGAGLVIIAGISFGPVACKHMMRTHGQKSFKPGIHRRGEIGKDNMKKMMKKWRKDNPKEFTRCIKELEQGKMEKK